MFTTREEAGQRLAAYLSHLRGAHPLVVAPPRGGVATAAPIAALLAAPLDVLIVRKLPVPGQPELAMGSMVDGDPVDIVWNEEILRDLQVSEQEQSASVIRELAAMGRRRARYRSGRQPVSPEGRTVIVVDDGIATGATARAALRALRRLGAARLVLAVPVGPYETVLKLRREADVVVCLEQPPDFTAIGAYYEDFTPTSDSEVVDLLDEAARRVGGG